MKHEFWDTAKPKTQIYWNYFHLSLFKQLTKEHREKKESGPLLFLLKKYAEIKIPVRTIDYKTARKTKSVHKLHSNAHALSCFACFHEFTPAEIKQNRIVIHHILMISNGGLDKKSNRVTLCTKCHAVVHPWLK